MSAATAYAPDARATGQSEYVTFRVADQWIGIPVMIVQEVLVAQRIARVPMSPAEVAGFLNLRGQIVTAVDLRTTLRLDPRDADAEFMNVVVQHEHELFAFMVDEVGDVVTVADHAIEPALATLDARWRSACSGIVRREHGLLVVMKVPDLLKLDHPSG
jgi:purine-binding chemotaxis protein CheW